jgi:hypothetical protein
MVITDKEMHSVDFYVNALFMDKPILYKIVDHVVYRNYEVPEDKWQEGRFSEAAFYDLVKSGIFWPLFGQDTGKKRSKKSCVKHK